MPRSTAIGHCVGLPFVVDVAHGEKDLILIRVVEDIVVEEPSLFVEEVETQAPALQPSANDADIVRPALSLVLL